MITATSGVLSNPKRQMRAFRLLTRSHPDPQPDEAGVLIVLNRRDLAGVQAHEVLLTPGLRQLFRVKHPASHLRNGRAHVQRDRDDVSTPHLRDKKGFENLHDPSESAYSTADGYDQRSPNP